MNKKELIQQLRSQRVSYDDIALRFGTTKQAVHSYCKYHGIVKGNLSAKTSYDDKRKQFIQNSVIINPTTQCWEWQKTLSSGGYGRLSYKGNSSYAHRVSYHLHKDSTFSPFQVGRNEENSIHVLHKCDNPSCCNPDHLWLGTPRDNMLDRDIKGRGKK